MGNDNGRNPDDVSRRDTLKLAAAVGALGAGLGALLQTEDAWAEDFKLDQKSLGSIAFKLFEYKGTDDWRLLKTVDLSEHIKLKLSAKDKVQSYTFKLYYVQDKDKKTEKATALLSHQLQVSSTKIKAE